MFYDWTMIFVIPGLLFALWAQFRVSSAYKKYSKIPAAYRGTAAEAASRMLLDAGNTNVSIKSIAGELTDHYNPQDETLSLSQGVYSSNSIAALGIAAHEAGHAMQKKEGYALMGLRSAIVPVVNIGSNLSMPLFVLGLILSYYPLQAIGIVLFSFYLPLYADHLAP